MNDPPDTTEAISHVSPLLVLTGILMSTLSMQVPDTHSAYWRGGVHITGMLVDERLGELSGLESSSSSDYLWAHNDSGDVARLFLINGSGHVLKPVKLVGIDVFDAEDLSAGPCRPGTSTPPRCLYFGDMGDNRHQRPAIVVHRILEPDLSRGELPDALEIAHSMRLVHPEGKAMDAEALMSHPRSGELYIMEKSRKGMSRLLRVPDAAFDAPSPGGKAYELEVIGTLKLAGESRSGRLVTAGTFSPDGRCMVLRTYLEVLTFCKSDPEQGWGEVLEQEPDRFVPPGMLQSEAIAFDRTGSGLWITSERIFSPIVRIDRGSEVDGSHEVLSTEKK